MMTNPASLHKKDWLFLLLILFIATALRLGSPGVVEFKRDEAVLSRLAIETATGEKFHFLGMGSSTGFPNTPINVYLMSIPYLFSSNPLFATLFVGFLNILGVALLWKLTDRYLGRDVAFVATAFMAISPWAVIYSRKIWAQDLLMPFIIATIFTALLGFIDAKPKRWAQFIHFPLLSLTVQIHFGAISIVLISVVVLWLGRRYYSWSMLAGIIMAILLTFPYLYGLQANNWLTRDTLQRGLNSTDEEVVEDQDHSRQLEITAFEQAWFTINGTNIHALTGAETFEDYLDTIPFFAYWYLRLIFLLGLILSSLWIVRNYKAFQSLILVLLLWLLTPVFLFIFSWVPVQPHYFIPMLPPAFILMGIAFTSIQMRKVSLLLVGGVFALQIIMVLQFIHFVDMTYTRDGFGIPLKYQLMMRQEILDKNPRQVIVLSEHSSIEYDEAPAVWDVLLTDINTVRFVEGERLMIVPSNEAMLLTTKTIENNNLGEPDTIVQTRPNEGVYQLWNEFPISVPEGGHVLDARFANGVVLEKTIIVEAEMTLVWRLPEPFTSELFITFVHVLDESGNKLAQIDTPFVASAFWQENDQVIQTIPIDSTGSATLNIGMYALRNGNYLNSEYLDANGQYLDQFFILNMEEINED